MKGTIVKCLEEMVLDQYGQGMWANVLKDVGVQPGQIFLPIADIDDALVMKIVSAVINRLHCPLAKLADDFGNYWVKVYSQKLYPQYYANSMTAKDFLLSLDTIHVVMTKTIANARPPHFQYVWKDERTLIMYYRSHRGLLDFAMGLIRGVGAFYHEDLKVSKIGADKIQVEFAA